MAKTNKNKIIGIVPSEIESGVFESSENQLYNSNKIGEDGGYATTGSCNMNYFRGLGLRMKRNWTKVAAGAALLMGMSYFYLGPMGGWENYVKPRVAKPFMASLEAMRVRLTQSEEKNKELEADIKNKSAVLKKLKQQYSPGTANDLPVAYDKNKVYDIIVSVSENESGKKLYLETSVDKSDHEISLSKDPRNYERFLILEAVSAQLKKIIGPNNTLEDKLNDNDAKKVMEGTYKMYLAHQNGKTSLKIDENGKPLRMATLAPEETSELFKLVKSFNGDKK